MMIEKKKKKEKYGEVEIIVEQKAEVKQEEVQEVPKAEEPELIEFKILRVFSEPPGQYFSLMKLQCEKCGRKDFPAYEICQIEGSSKSMEMICYGCLMKAGYIRRPSSKGWAWKHRSEK